MDLIPTIVLSNRNTMQVMAVISNFSVATFREVNFILIMCFT